MSTKIEKGNYTDICPACNNQMKLLYYSEYEIVYYCPECGKLVQSGVDND